jgi:nucleotide-binding universal stress UspA family protein
VVCRIEAVGPENSKSRDDAARLMAEYSQRVDLRHQGECFIVDSTAASAPRRLATHGRSHDMTIVPVDDGLEAVSMAEALIFHSGRPALLLPRAGGSGHRFEDVVIGWDGGRAAARSVADALPLCSIAKSVRLVHVGGEPRRGEAGEIASIQRNLRLHDIAAKIEVIAAAERDAGSALMAYAAETGADLLVMGGYGHARAQEFILGGATRSVLHDVRLPVLMSH